LSKRLQGIVLGGAARRTGPNMTRASRLTHDDGSCAIYSSCALLGVLSEAGGAFLSVLDKRKLAELMRARRCRTIVVQAGRQDRGSEGLGLLRMRTHVPCGQARNRRTIESLPVV
jgi:DNA-binding IscR family transcriptional regulator